MPSEQMSRLKFAMWMPTATRLTPPVPAETSAETVTEPAANEQAFKVNDIDPGEIELNKDGKGEIDAEHDIRIAFTNENGEREVREFGSGDDLRDFIRDNNFDRVDVVGGHTEDSTGDFFTVDLDTGELMYHQIDETTTKKPKTSILLKSMTLTPTD